jgi:N-acetylglucosaminyldiphosphoundecaprenol N-acetyl-beta-D-mannosaminyltransferase
MKPNVRMKKRSDMTETATPSPEGSVNIMGVRINSISAKTAMERIRHGITAPDQPGGMNILFANVHTIHLAKKDSKFRTVINNADLMLPDGSGLNLAGRVFGTPILENLNGTDFTPQIFRAAMKEGWTIYLLGAREKVIVLCRARLLELYPDLRIVGYHDGHSLEGKEELIIQDIRSKRPDILFIALGSPLQETWIAHHAREVNARICLGVGGLFDFIAGDKRRAPQWMRRLGIEWVFRFLQDPMTKWKRVFVEIPVFLIELFGEWIRRRYLKPAQIHEEISL